MSNPLRRLPAVNRLADSSALEGTVRQWGRAAVVDACRAAIDGARRAIAEGAEVTTAELVDGVLETIRASERDAYAPVINATGVLLHTNLGRAPAVSQPAALEGYLTLEYDLEHGRRGSRSAPLADLFMAVFGAPSTVMVNNNAASLLLILTGLARGREVIVSRSQLIEIGGSFRLPEIMEAAGCRLVEVGCTNRTHLRDYEAAITAETATVLIAHQSNFRISGFVSQPSTGELAGLAHQHGLPLVVDQGSGCLYDLRRWNLPREETVADILRAGADIVCFSGDKLLGGPQAGLIVGSEAWVADLGRHPLYRAMRPDKGALTAMDRTLRAHRAGRLDDIPLYALLATPPEILKRRAGRIGRALRSRGVPARRRATRAALGGGTTPEATLASWGLGITGDQVLAAALRAGAPPVIARIEEDEVVLDLRAVPTGQDRLLIDAVVAAYGPTTGGHNRQVGGSAR